MKPFPHATATATEIEARATTLVGRRLIDLQPGLAPMVPSSATTKGVVGRIYEACFDIPPNSRAGPDFEGASIELKSVPVLLAGMEARAKERISVGMIRPESLAGETWEAASVRHKLDRLLLIFYRWEPLQPIARFETLAAGIWHPDDESIRGIQSDWEHLRALAASGRWSEASESSTRLLGAATKGPGHGSTSRAWSLKQPFVTWIYRSMTGQTDRAPRIPTVDPATTFEAQTLRVLEPYVGRPFDALATAVGRAGQGGKAGASAIVRALLGQRPRGKQGDFARFGVEVKTVPVDPRGVIIESMSFPAFVHEELIFESWEDSDLLGRLNRLLIVPIHRSRDATLAEMTLGRAFFWSPSEANLRDISIEWERFRGLIETGRSRDLPKASDTSFIHVRPKARDARDREQAPGGFDVIKKCFWLNQHYLEAVLADHDALTPP